MSIAGQGKGAVRAILYALGANAGIAVAKGGAAFWTGSGAMLADTLHSIADCADPGLLLRGLQRWQRCATADHPLGYGRATCFWSMIVALMCSRWVGSTRSRRASSACCIPRRSRTRGSRWAYSRSVLRWKRVRCEVDTLRNLIMLQWGNGVVVVAKVRMREAADARRLVEQINACEVSLKQRFPEVSWILFEPDVVT